MATCCNSSVKIPRERETWDVHGKCSHIEKVQSLPTKHTDRNASKSGTGIQNSSEALDLIIGTAHNNQYMYNITVEKIIGMLHLQHDRDETKLIYRM